MIRRQSLERRSPLRFPRQAARGWPIRRGVPVPGRGDEIMVGPFRRFATLLALGLLFPSSMAVMGQEATPKSAPTDPGARLTPGEFALPGEDPPRAFVPARPRTVEE